MSAPRPEERAVDDDHVVVCIGASWGGFDAVRAVLGGLPADLPAAVCIAQHRPDPDDLVRLVGVLGRASALPVCEPEDKEPLRAGHVYLAPAGYHLLVNDGHAALNVEDRVRWSRPSIDVLFESAAAARGPHVVAVVLTGANDDGARGALAVHEAGGCVIVQDPDTSERSEMPRATIALASPDAVLPLEAIAAEVVRRVGAG